METALSMGINRKNFVHNQEKTISISQDEHTLIQNIKNKNENEKKSEQQSTSTAASYLNHIFGLH